MQWIAGESPAEWPGALAIPRGDELFYRRAEFVGRAEATVAQTMALENAEEQLHLVDPGRVLRRVMEDGAVIVAGVWRLQRCRRAA